MLLNLYLRFLKEVFDMVYECGASLDIKNRQGLTPLTLAAKLAMQEVSINCSICF